MYKYTILTFIIGKNYEKVHEITSKQDDVEYLLITDDETLKSDTWEVVFDTDLLQYKSPFERCFSVRYNVFKYCHTDICVTVDGSMLIKGSLDRLIDVFNSGHYDICLMPHPIWPDMISEYNAWIRMRGYPVARATLAIQYLKQHGYDLEYKGLFQLCFSVKRRSALTDAIDSETMTVLRDFSGDGDFERLDQTFFSYVMNTRYSDTRVLPVSEQTVRSSAIQWYWHNSDKPNMNVFYDISKPDMKYVFNKETECLYI